MGGAQVQSMTLTPPKHFGTLKGGVVVVGMQESHLQCYALELGSDPPSPLYNTVWSWVVETGTGFPA